MEYVSASLSLTEAHSASFGATALEYARLVGEALHRRMLEEPMDSPRWFSRAPGADGEAVEGSLYYGSAGIALFLAYLDSIDPDERLRWAAERAVAHTLGGAPGGIGAFQGLAGLRLGNALEGVAGHVGQFRVGEQLFQPRLEQIDAPVCQRGREQRRHLDVLGITRVDVRALRNGQ